MENKKISNPKILSVSRTIAKHFIVLCAYLTVRYFFYMFSKDLKFTPPEKTLWETIMFFFIYGNTSFAFNAYNKREYIIFTSKATHPPLMYELLSYEFLFDQLCMLFFMIIGIFNVYYRVAIPFALIINALTFILPRRKWRKGKGEASKNHSTARLAWYVTFIILEGSVLFLLFAGSIPVIAMYVHILAVVLPYLDFVYILIILFILLAYLKALKKRIKFIKRLKKFCKTHNCVLSELHKPYISIFYTSTQPNFTIESNGKKYDCKLISFTNKFKPAVFRNDGFFYRTSARNLKYGIVPLITAERRYAFDSENKKILVLTSIPYKIVIAEFGKVKLLDTGDTCGEYKIFNPDGFFGAVERGTIERKTFN